MASPNTLQVLVVDDEAPARRKILRLLRQETDVQVVAEASGAESAIAAIEKHRPNLVFLDVQMSGTDGFGVVRAIPAKEMPRIVFVTAHDQYALRAFEVHAFDYLLKPFGEERFRAVLQRAREQNTRSSDEFGARLDGLLRQLQRERAFPDRLLVHENGRAHFVPVRDIAWIEADRNYLIVHCGVKEHTLRGTLDSLAGTLDPRVFVRINRGSLVRLDAIREMLPWFHGEYKVILKDSTELRWSRRYVKQRPELLKVR
ncbi:MAG TPA: LytTR family DNA-binding domain-containing protein [Candidatus Acidoferrum sp.]|nr:LytTR family DNA-binding domain-containing protein [Candidatus Acidoferrum sp.]